MMNNKTVTFKGLEKTLSSLFPGTMSYLSSHFWKTENKRELNLEFVVCHPDNIMMCRAGFIISFDYNLVVTKVENICEIQSKKISNLIGLRLNTASMVDYQLEVGDMPDLTVQNRRIGHIIDNSFKPLSKTMFKDFQIQTSYLVDNNKSRFYKNIEDAEIFKRICKKYYKYIADVGIYDEYSTDYHVSLNIKGIDIYLKLQQFFSYTLSIKIKGNDCSINLSNKNEFQKMESVLDAILSGKDGFVISEKHSYQSQLLELRQL